MKDWLVRILVLLTLGVVLGVPFVLRPADDAGAAIASATQPTTAPATRPETQPAASSGGAVADELRLVILTPHNEQIRYEVAHAYNRARVAHGLAPIVFDWRSSGGSSDLRKQLIAEYQNAIDHQGELPGYDLMFGGGDFEHNILAKGLLIKRGKAESRLPLTVSAGLSPADLKAAFPDAAIAGVKLYHPEQRWVGVVLSSFGIIYNRDVLGMLGLPEPTTWTDLCDGAYRNNVALADPAHSGSIAVTYNTILRRMGWKEGWGSLRRIFANARYFTTSAGKVPVDVSAGEAGAGMCIDFYGRFQAGAVGNAAVGYVDPAYMTAITPDPISLLRGGQHPALAREFIRWLVSAPAQRIWQARRGEPDGPERFELRRLPIRRDLYQPEETKHWVDRVDPWSIARPLPAGMPDFYPAVGPVTHAMAIDLHDELKAAWQAILANPTHPRRARMLELFDAMPPELTIVWPDAELAQQWQAILPDAKHPRQAEAAAHLKKFVDGLAARYNGWKDADKILSDRLAWTIFFRGNYKQIIAIAGER
ncbi:MAG: extracellular solute-binding protein [Planctomycetota bacterium]|nr:extracellular solute-binding protein [Planctomycetota bacterium]